MTVRILRAKWAFIQDSFMPTSTMTMTFERGDAYLITNLLDMRTLPDCSTMPRTSPRNLCGLIALAIIFLKRRHPCPTSWLLVSGIKRWYSWVWWKRLFIVGSWGCWTSSGVDGAAGGQIGSLFEGGFGMMGATKVLGTGWPSLPWHHKNCPIDF